MHLLGKVVYNDYTRCPKCATSTTTTKTTTTTNNNNNNKDNNNKAVPKKNLFPGNCIYLLSFEQHFHQSHHQF